MLAACVTIGLFAFWGLLGHALMAWAGTRLSRVRDLLLAPAVGMVVNALPLLVLNTAGLPLSQVVYPVAVLLLAGAVALLWRLRPGAPAAREWLPFAGALAVALAITGGPMFYFGFDWLSFCNDDMANYVMGTQRLIDGGYFDFPDQARLFSGYDYTQYLYFLHVPGMHRPGSEMILGFVAMTTGLLPAQVFMPVILTMHLALVAAAGAMVYDGERNRRVAIGAAWLMALSSLTTLGTLYQLIAQVGGLALLVTCATLLLRPFDDWPRRELRRYGVLLGVVVAGLAVTYPELAPFLAIGYVAWAGVSLLRGTLPVRPVLTAAAVAIPVGLLLLNRAVPTTVAYIMRQGGTGTVPDDPTTTLFPYYLMPTGLANLWGFQRLAVAMDEPFQSVVIAAGALLLAAVALAALRRAWGGCPAATFTLVMLGVGLYLFRCRSGFGLFKLGMFVQPFLLGTAAAAWFAFVRRRDWAWLSERPRLQFVPLLSAALLAAPSLYSYVRLSCGHARSFVEIADASASRLLGEMRGVAEAHPSDKYVIDSYNVVLAKFQAIATRGRQAFFPSTRLFHVGGYVWYPGMDADRIVRVTQGLIADHALEYTTQRFALHDGRGRYNEFSLHTAALNVLEDGDGIVVGATAKHSAFNRRHRGGDGDGGAAAGRNFYVRPVAEARNHLIFVASERGMPYWAGGGRARYALFQLENEPTFYRDATMAGVGRHLLFQVLSPTDTVRVVLDVTSSHRADGENVLPASAAAVGARRHPMGLLGRGSARVVSPPLRPQVINGLSYVALDLGEDGKQFPTPRTGLMNLYGTDVSTDRRKLVGFVRDVSVISEEQYQLMAPPSRLEHFGCKWYQLAGHDLRKPDVEYAGLYEDGWVAERAFARLAEPAEPCRVVARGVGGPQADPATERWGELLVDGAVVARRRLQPGLFFELAAPTPAGDTRTGSAAEPGRAGKPRRVELRFSQVERLQAPDNRPVAARMEFIGFKPLPREVIAAGGAAAN